MVTLLLPFGKTGNCSYDLSGFDDAMGVYFYKYDIILGAYILGAKRLFINCLGGIRNDSF